jgi:hypothetical protein
MVAPDSRFVIWDFQFRMDVIYLPLRKEPVLSEGEGGTKGVVITPPSIPP